MKTLILTNSNLNLGAGVYAEEIKKLLSEQGIDCKILVNQYSGKKDDVINVQSPKYSKFIAALKTTLDKKYAKKIILGSIRILNCLIGLKSPYIFKTLHQSKYIVQDIDQTKKIYHTEELIQKLNGFIPDNIVVIFMQNFINFENLFELQQAFGSPVYISMVDMGPITGGCHYSWDCNGFETNCENCPAVPSYYRGHIKNNLNFKKQIQDVGNFNFIYSSFDQKRELLKSSLVKAEYIYQIHVPIDEKIFTPNEQLRKITRRDLNFEEQDIVLFFGAMNLANPRKGGKVLANALSEILSEDISNLKVLIIGDDISLFKDLIPDSMLRTLKTVKPSELSNYYNASDFFVSPSLADSGPMMVNQSIMCGTRVVSFKVGVAENFIVENQYAGRLGKLKTSQALKQTILEEIHYQKDSDRSYLRQKCHEFANSVTSRKKVSIYWKELLSNTSTI